MSSAALWAFTERGPWTRSAHMRSTATRTSPNNDSPTCDTNRRDRSPHPAFLWNPREANGPGNSNSHYDHPGWYIVWRYLVDETETIEPGLKVVVWRIDVAFLEKKDWKYEASTAGAGGGGRTHTFGIRNAAKVFRQKSL